ncbi:hypothetical protein [Paracoccus sp. N5]|uniref:hypothetical protein n=1 Tax=Paracoccus sp. N5 TaxID=1101189 RepID=UPI0012F82105|nr:hypothetical protein [Paracoccus sp. N5]
MRRPACDSCDCRDCRRDLGLKSREAQRPCSGHRGDLPQNREIATIATLVAATDGWLAYGAALNEGRALFAEDRAFGKWIAENLSDNLSVSPNDHERAAAMWAAANADQLAEAKSGATCPTLMDKVID